MATSSKSKSNRPRKSNSISSRTSTALTKTEITINVYDLLPPGRLSSLLWTIGGSLLHSGVVINDKEYAFGGHGKRNVTGVYYTSPNYEPPGGTFRLSVLQGFTFRTEQEIQQIVKDVSNKFLGPSYNLLTYNCNHFTSALCEALTGRPAPAWLNRAASIGLALPCVVPKEWIAPPDVDTVDGELLEEDEDEEDEYAHERAGMLESDRRRRQREEERQRRRSSRGSYKDRDRGGGSGTSSSAEDEVVGQSLAGGKRIVSGDQSPPPRLVSMKDTAGRDLPVAERAPIPKATKS